MTQTEIRLAEPGRFEAVNGTLPDPSPGEARVRIRRIGVCGTDIHAFHGRQPFFEYPRVLGHELAAEIVACHGPDEGFRSGELVAIEPYLNDPESPASRKGKSNCCEALQVLGVHCDGGMRPEINIPVRKLHRTSSLGADQLALVEMLGIGQHAVQRSGASPTDKALIIGTGPIGLSVLSFLRLVTEHIVVADLDQRRRDFCREAFGVAHTLGGGNPSALPDSLRDAFGGELPDLIFDATGSRHSMQTCFDLVAHGGRLVMVGLFQGDLAFNDPNFHQREISLLASRNATSKELDDVIHSIEIGQVDTGPWITHRLELSEVPDRFPGMVRDPTLRKAVIHLDG